MAISNLLKPQTTPQTTLQNTFATAPYAPPKTTTGADLQKALNVTYNNTTVPSSTNQSSTKTGTTQPIKGLVPPPVNTGSASGTSAGQSINQTVPPPITGNVQTPSGATVNATTGGLVSTAPTAPLSYPGLVGQVAQYGSTQSPATQQGLATAKTGTDAYAQAIANLSKSRQNEAESLATNASNPIPLNFQQGRAQILQNQYLQQQNAYAQEAAGAASLYGPGLTAATTGQGQQIGAAGTAAGYAQPSLAGFNQQVFNPLTGGLSGGSSVADAVAFQVQKLKNGTAGYQDALDALQAYGQPAINALQQAVGPNFNVTQSNALAGQQGTIGPAFDYAKTALANLQTAVGNLGIGQNTNIPILNSLSQGLSATTGIGSQQVQAFKAAIAEARSAIQKVLASVQGGTPTDYVGQSNALLPDNATPNQIQAALETLNTLGTAKQAIYGNPGFSGVGQTNTGGSGLYSW